MEPVSDNFTSRVNLDEQTLRRLVPEGTVRTWPRGVIIVCEGDFTDAIYVVLSGLVKVYMSDEDGKEVILNVIGPGDYFGEFVLDGGPRSASVLTTEPTRLFMIPRQALEGLITGNPEFARDLIERLIRKVRSLAGTVRDFALRDVYGRLVAFINSHALERDGRRVMDRMTHQEIAAHIGSSREMVSRIFKELTTGGYIEVESRQIVVMRKLPERW